MSDLHLLGNDTPEASSRELSKRDVSTRRRTVLVLGRSGAADSLDLLDCLADDPDDAVHFFARQALDKVLKRVREKTGDVFQTAPEEISAGLQSTAVTERIRAARRCAWQKPPVLRERLLARIDQESESPVLAQLVRAILLYRDASHRDRMIGYLTYPDENVRSKALEGFLGWKDPVVLGAVIGRFKDKSHRVQANALVIAVAQPSHEARNLAKRLLRSDHPSARLAATYGLGILGTGWALQELMALLVDRTQPDTVVDLAREILPPSAAMPPSPAGERAGQEDRTVRTDLTQNLPPIPDEGTVLECLGDGDILIRIHGIQNAPRFGSEGCIEALHHLAETERDPLAVATLVPALREIRGAKDLVWFQALLNHPDARVRANALEAMSSLDRDVDQATLYPLLEDEAPRTRMQALALLLKKRPQAALERLREMVLGPNKSTRESISYLLAQLRDDRLMPIFREALRDGRQDVCRQAYEVLKSVEKEWKVAADLLEDYCNGDLVGEVIDGQPVASLLEMLESSSGGDRIKAIKSLVGAEDDRVETMFELNLAAKDPEVRMHAQCALVQRHKEKTFPRLYGLLGRTYSDLSSDGAALVPHHLRAHLRQFATAESSAHEDVAALLGRMGQELYAAFERDVVFDEELRAICQEIRVAKDQILSFDGEGAGASRGRCGQIPASAPLDDVSRRRTAPTPILAPARGERPSTDRPVPSWSPHPILVAGLGAVYMLSIYGAYELGRRQSGQPLVEDDAGAPAQTPVQVLDAMSLEANPKLFDVKFKGKRVVVQATLAQVDQAQHLAKAMSGSVPLRVSIDSAAGLPPGGIPGHRVEIAGTVDGLDKDGTVRLVNGRLAATTGQ